MANKAALIILDGFGITPEAKGNAVLNAKTPNLDMLLPIFPKALLKASGEEVGLPWGEFGSSEVGHTTIGLGRIVLQNLPQITQSLATGQFEKKPIFGEILQKVDQGAKINLIFIASNGAVHGHMDHAVSIIKLLKRNRPKCIIKLHLITDGRDTAEKSAEAFVKDLLAKIPKDVVIASIMGRYYAMDRDKNWDRIALAFQAMLGQGPRANDPLQIIQTSYNSNLTDEFIQPYSLTQEMPDFAKDVFIFTNYRADRALQLSRVFTDSSIKEIPNCGQAKNFYAMTTYDDNMGLGVLFSNIDLADSSKGALTEPLSKIISANNLKQLHTAETEKYAHITYFFAGGIKEPFAGQQNVLIQSKKMPSYESFPQMRIAEISQTIIDSANKGYDFIAANFANGDMVGHSGNFQAVVQAVQIMDGYLGKVVSELFKKQYKVIICSDHGNCDEMIDFNNGRPNKEHSLNPVPFILCDLHRKGTYTSKDAFFNSRPVGLLADIAPTILDAMGIAENINMTGLNIVDSMV